MLRVITPLGKLVEVNCVTPVVEKEVRFNGKKKRLFERALGFEQKPTGIVFYLRQQVNCGMLAYEPNLYVGNMRPEKVQSVVREMLEQGYYDLSAIKYQSSKGFNDQVIDNGESPAYSSETTPGSFPVELGSMFAGGCGCGGMNSFGGGDVFASCQPSCDDEFFGREDEEDC